MDGCDVTSRRLVYMDEVSMRLGVSYRIMVGYVKDGLIGPPRVVGSRVAWTDQEVEGLIDRLPREWPRGRGRPRKGERTVGRGG
jgi:predicted DNA-binding transcriptional regulator AlpA